MNKKFNVIDLIVLLFVCAVVVFVGYKFVLKDAFSKDNLSKSKFPTKDVICTVKVGEVIESTAKALPSSGMLEDVYGTEVGKVLSKKVVDSEVIQLKSDGQYVKVVNPGKKDVYLEVEAEATIKDEGYYIASQISLGSGSGATLKAKDIVFWGYIIDIKEK